MEIPAAAAPEEKVQQTNPPILVGLGLIALSTAIFLMPQFSPMRPDSMFGFFFFHYAIAIIYLVYLLARSVAKYRWRFARQSVVAYTPFLVLSLISAFALNRELPVFQESTSWLSVFLVIQCVALLSFFFF